MDSAERKLIDLHNLITQYQRTKDESLLSNIQVVRSEINEILNTRGSGDINVNIDDNDTLCHEGPPGPPGPPGEPGVCTCKCKSISVSDDYIATCDDYYIGVDSNQPVTITLPEDCPNCCEIIVKAEMGPPLGNRKVTVTTSDGSLIDGDDEYVIVVPYGVVNVICNNGDWYII
jgi:hypothetical protein